MADKHTTILDVARAAGVSTATVSHSINSTGRITARTRQRVLAIARRLQYYPNRHAASLASRHSRTLGVVVSDIENPFFAVAIRSFEACARRWQYEVIVSETNYQLPLMRRAAERMLEQKVCGVAILTSEMNPTWLGEIVRRSIPVACFDLDFTNERAINIRVDYASGMKELVEHLYGLGHRRIGFVGGRQSFKNILSRQENYVASMTVLGLEPAPVIIGNQRPDGGYEAGLALLATSPRPTAVVAVNDLTAVGLIKAFSDHGLRVPQDISVTGFDNTYLAAYFTPRLTTVDMHPDVLGQLAATALHEASTLPEIGGREQVIKINLVVGESSGPAPDTISQSVARGSEISIR